jgi:protein TonB
VFTTTAETAESAFSVAPQPAAPVESTPIVSAQAPHEGAVTAARFDADYLHNPAPAYPYSARRNHEEGKVVLLVLVSPQGTTKSLKVHRTSGFRALDEAALDAVQRWRFVPARRGDEPVEDWVLVPVSFHLNRS